MWLVRFHCVQVVLTTLGFTRSFCMLMQLVTDGLSGKFLHANATSHRWALGGILMYYLLCDSIDILLFVFCVGIEGRHRGRTWREDLEGGPTLRTWKEDLEGGPGGRTCTEDLHFVFDIQGLMEDLHLDSKGLCSTLVNLVISESCVIG
jgi:hypothetical protein